MRRAAAPLLALAVLAAHAARADDAPPAAVQPAAQPIQRVIVVEEPNPDFKNRVSFNALGLLIGIGSFNWERELAPRLGLEISPWGIYFGFGDDKIYGAGLGVGVAFYPTNGNSPEGLRLAASVAPGFVGASGTSDKVFMFGGKATIGYNAIWRSGFSLGINGGVQYIHYSLTNSSSRLNGVLPTVDFNLGFAF